MWDFICVALHRLPTPIFVKDFSFFRTYFLTFPVQQPSKQMNDVKKVEDFNQSAWFCSYLWSIAEITPPPLFFPRIKMFFTFISEMGGSKRGTAMQNRASWGGTNTPEAVFFFWPWRNFNRPWNCMVWSREENTGLHVIMCRCFSCFVSVLLVYW